MPAVRGLTCSNDSSCVASNSASGILALPQVRTFSVRPEHHATSNRFDQTYDNALWCSRALCSPAITNSRQCVPRPRRTIPDARPKCKCLRVQLYSSAGPIRYHYDGALHEILDSACPVRLTWSIVH